MPFASVPEKWPLGVHFFPEHMAGENMRKILQYTAGGTRRKTEFHGFHGPSECYVPLSQVELKDLLPWR